MTETSLGYDNALLQVTGIHGNHCRNLSDIRRKEAVVLHTTIDADMDFSSLAGISQLRFCNCKDQCGARWSNSEEA
jgi:hypothetical protein